MKKRGRNRGGNLRFGPLDYSKNKNSLWRLEIFRNFNRYFRPNQFKDNLKQLSRLAENDKRFRPFLRFYGRYWDIYAAGISNFSNIYHDSGALLSKTIPYKNRTKKGLSFRTVGKLIRDHLEHVTEPWVIIGDDHRVSHITIKELVSKNKTRTAIVVIDNHADIYGPSPAKNNPLKFNPFRNLIESGIVEHVFFLCPSFKELGNDKLSWEELKHDISLIPIGPSVGREGFNQKRFETSFARILKRKAIESIYFSIDIDVLADNRRNTIYSAFEYSVLNSILYLSLLSDAQVRKYKCLSGCVIDLAKMFPEKRKSPSAMRIRNPYQPGLNTVNEKGITPTACCDIIRKIATLSRRRGLAIGLGSCAGEVVELLGPDWKGRTTRAVVQIADFLTGLPGSPRN